MYKYSKFGEKYLLLVIGEKDSLKAVGSLKEWNIVKIFPFGFDWIENNMYTVLPLRVQPWVGLLIRKILKQRDKLG